MKQITLITITLLLLLGCNNKEPELLQYKQDTSYLLKDIKPLHVDMKSFNSRVFIPWDITTMNMSKKRASWANYVYTKKGAYYAQNTLPWSEEEVKNIIKNTNFENYNTQKRYAITIKNTQARNLPTNKPFYLNPKHAGEGFPFDYLQNSRVHINTPLFISHYSSDGAWAFIQNPFSSGWLKTEALTILDAKERTQQQNSKKIVITKDNLPIYSNTQEYLLHVKLGAMFSYIKEDDEYFHSYMYSRFSGKIPIIISKKTATLMPLPFTKENVFQVSSELLGEKYGWRGYLSNRDCSAMTKDFFAPFAIWLPRNSAGQKNSGKYISFEGLNSDEKESLILQKGIPFASLIYLKGHIMLYAGEHNGKAMVMHNTWGVKTYENGKNGRALIGKAIISDLYLGSNQHNVKKESILITRTEGLVLKPDIQASHYNPVVKAYPSIIKIQNNLLYFDDNSTLKYDDNRDKTFKQMLTNPTIKDTISLKYPAFKDTTAPKRDFDPGRFRNEKLLKKLYGQNEQEIKKNLVKLKWIDGTIINFNQRQNASLQLTKVIAELKQLPIKYSKYLKNIGGTFKYRYILGTKRLSTHSFGIGIDINVKNANYWRWDKNKIYKNKIPKKIVDIFEKHGFIWGGRWYHYDTMHFEYRPELFRYID